MPNICDNVYIESLGNGMNSIDSLRYLAQIEYTEYEVVQYDYLDLRTPTELIAYPFVTNVKNKFKSGLVPTEGFSDKATEYAEKMLTCVPAWEASMFTKLMSGALTEFEKRLMECWHAGESDDIPANARGLFSCVLRSIRDFNKNEALMKAAQTSTILPHDGKKAFEVRDAVLLSSTRYESDYGQSLLMKFVSNGNIISTFYSGNCEFYVGSIYDFKAKFKNDRPIAIYSDVGRIEVTGTNVSHIKVIERI